MQRREVLGALGAGWALGALPRFAGAQTDPGRSRIVLLGTQGGPNFNLLRGESASVLIIDGHLYLVDCGYGALAALVRANLNYRNVDQIFLTHLHDDHVADVVSLMGHQWTGGRVDKVNIRGPRGTRQLVAAAIEYGKANEAIRLVDESRTVRLRDLFTAHEVKAHDSATAVYADARVRVTAIENSHYPVESKRHMAHRALSYRFDAKDRSVVFSGDTAYSGNLVTLARGADVLICEAMHVEATRKGFDERVAAGAYADNPEGIWKHIVSTHTPLDVAGRMAREAGVKTLVLNHLIPGGWNPEMTDAEYAGPAASEFKGEIIVGRDQLTL